MFSATLARQSTHEKLTVEIDLGEQRLLTYRA